MNIDFIKQINYRRADGCWNCIFAKDDLASSLIATCSFVKEMTEGKRDWVVCDHICNNWIKNEVQE